MKNFPQAKSQRFIFFLLVFLSVYSFSAAQNGTLDASFGSGGKTITDFGGPADYGTCMALQTDNKIVVGGYATLAAQQYFALARYSANGLIDSSFGVNGKAITGFDGTTGAFLEAMKIQADGKIVTAGYIVDGANSNFAVVRYKTDGTPDSSFGTNGIVIKILTGSDNHCNAVAIDTAGGIIIAGNQGCKPIIIRLQPNGNTDLLFLQNNTASIVAFAAQGGCEKINSLFLLSTNEIVIAGEETTSVDNMFLMRFTPDGVTDSTFGTDGTVNTKTSDTSEIFASVQQPDGKIIVAGFSAATGSGRSIEVVRYKRNGQLDSTFGTNGKVLIPFSGSATGYSVKLESNGDIVVAGTLINTNGDHVDALFVLKPNATLDSTFGTGGKAIVANEMGDYITASIIQPDGKIVVAGYTLSADSTGYNFIVSRFNETAALPIKLASFTGVLNKNTVELNWVTASEFNSSYFSVERSGGLSFAAIGKVNCQGNSNQLQQYTFADLQPLQGNNYYRLKQVDKDGKFAYSNTVHIVLGTLPYLKAYPNPAKNSVSISGLGPSASLSLIDVSGKTIRQSVANGNTCAFNIQSLAPGIYFIRVKQGSKITILKMIKQ